MEVAIRKPTRSSEANRRWWSMLHAIEDAGAQWAGRTWTADAWHTIFMSAYCAMKQKGAGTMIRGLEGEAVLIGVPSTAKLTAEEFSELSAMTLAWMDNHQPPIPWGEER